MYFKKIYMHGFKSFAEPVTIEFHQGITCVVGPNGSGKSNLSDAIRWVLGEQSAKSLRGGKMEDVIFNGTANRKSRGMAEVTLTIDNETGILPIEYNEVAITRRMYRSGESEYKINGNQCRLKDIRELIMDTGIGVDGYSLIGQGKISEIIENKTEGRRQIFEEAAGIVMYRTKKHEAERKLASAESNLERVNDIVGEIEGRIDGLREDSIKAEEYLSLRDRFRELEINITLKNVDGIDEKLAEIRDDIKALEEENNQIRKSREEKADILSSSKEKSYALDEKSDDLRDRILHLIAEINELESVEKISAQKLESLEEERKRVSKEKNELNIRLATEEAKEREISLKLETCRENLESLSSVLSQKMEDLNARQEAAELALEAAEAAKTSMYEFSAKGQAKRAEARSYDGIKSAFNDRRRKIEEERRMSGESSLMENLNAAESRMKEYEGVIADIMSESENIKTQYQQNIAQEKELRNKLESINLEKGKIESRKKTLEELESNYEGYSGAVKFIMKRNLKGIYGTAAELMTVPKGYETAIETALGGGVSNIICSDDECAKKAVYELKTSNAGRLTFIPLDSIRHRKGQFPDEQKGFLGFASDIIKYESRFKAAYEYLLGRTVIADTMDNAVALSKKADSSLRFVTLDGEVIAGTGAITGGKYRNRTANLLERKAEVMELSTRLSELDAETSKIRGEVNKVKNDADECEIVLSRLNRQFSEAQSELNERKLSYANAKNQMESYAERSQAWDKELSDIEAKLASSDEIVNELIFEALEAEKNAREARVECESLFEKYEKKKEAAEKAEANITGARMDATSAEGEMNGILSLHDNINEQLNAIRGDINIKELRMNDIDIEINDIIKLKEEGSSTAEKADERKTLEEQLERLNAEKSELKKEMLDLENDIAASDEQLSRLSERKVSADIQSTKYETQLDNLKDKLWENFEISYLQAIEFKKEDFVLSKAVKENREIKNRISELGDVNVGAIEEYRQVSERYEFLTGQREDILTSMDSLNDIISQMDRTIKARFKESFNQVALNFGEVFKELFGGGYAELVLSDEDNPLEADIEIVAQPPEKKLQNINLLSGGEKTMTAIALMFAVLRAKPTPFCILDEVEAALDDDNMVRFATYLKNFDKIQFALITHQKTTMEHADVLYGVTMPERGISKVLSLKLGDTLPGLE